jgi:hypothetical protein
MGVKRSDYAKDSNVEGSYHNYMQGTDLLGIIDGGTETSTIDNLLGI